jgi:hypothetical protein
MKEAKVKYMSGGRAAGYYYIQLEGTNLIACEGGHPDFTCRLRDEEKAKKLCRKINKQLREAE